MIELREEDPKEKEQKLFAGAQVDIVYHGGNKKEITSIVEWMALYMNLLDLYRHVGAKARLDCAIKHGNFCCRLILRNKYKLLSVASYDGAARKAKQKSLDWSYDEAIGVAHLERYVPKEAESRSKGSRGSSIASKKVIKKRESGAKSSQICYNWAEGGCSRTPEACRFHHGCYSCNMTAKDKHALSKCANKKSAQRPTNGRTSA